MTCLRRVTISSVAAYSGFVDFLPTSSGDSKVRYIPLGLNLNGRLLPHVSLAMACAFRDVPLDSLRITGDRLVIPPGMPHIFTATQGHTFTYVIFKQKV